MELMIEVGIAKLFQSLMDLIEKNFAGTTSCQ